MKSDFFDLISQMEDDGNSIINMNIYFTVWQIFPVQSDTATFKKSPTNLETPLSFDKDTIIY